MLIFFAHSSVAELFGPNMNSELNLDFSPIESFDVTAILFADKYVSQAQLVYDQLSMQFPNKTLFLILSPNIACSYKSAKFESYVILGVECPLHPFKNAVYFKIPLPKLISQQIINHNGLVFADSIYEASQINSGANKTNELLIVTEEQEILDYYVYNYDNVISAFNLEIKDKVKYIMSENIRAEKLSKFKMFGVVFTSREFENIADNLCTSISSNSLPTQARAYKIYLRDISYERLISIDMIDCIVLVDCPIFACNINTHIFIVSPFTINVWLTGDWNDRYNKNISNNIRNINQETDESQLVLQGRGADIMEMRYFKGVPFANNNGDTTIYDGKSGIASCYDDEIPK